MRLAMILALQAAPSVPTPVDFDLAKHRPSGPDLTILQQCRPGDPDEIVVCARRRGDGYPMAEMERRYATKPLMAETSIGPGATVRAYADSVEMPGGQISKRAMIGIKLPF